MNIKNAKEIAKIDRQLDRFEAEFATIKQHLTLPLNGTAYAARLFGATTT